MKGKTQELSFVIFRERERERESENGPAGERRAKGTICCVSLFLMRVVHALRAEYCAKKKRFVL